MGAEVAALESDRALLEDATDWERQLRLADVDNLVNGAMIGNDWYWHTSCFRAWRRLAREEASARDFSSVRARDSEAYVRMKDFLRKAIAKSSDGETGRESLMSATFLSW